MREIKFRQFDKRLNDFMFFELVDTEIVITNDKVVSFDNDRTDSPIEQYTGLKDRNGVEIYEGDILGSEKSDSDAWYVSHHQVVWHDSGLMGKQICSNGSYIGIDYHTNRTSHPYVVIGNIHSNPELIGGK